MKTALFAASILLFALPARAQNRFAGGVSPSSLSFSGGGGVGGLGGGGLSSVSFGGASSNASARYQYVYVHGSNATYVPSTFVSFKTALQMGKAALAYHPKTIAEIAAEYRASKKKPRQ